MILFGIKRVENMTRRADNTEAQGDLPDIPSSDAEVTGTDESNSNAE